VRYVKLKNEEIVELLSPSSTGQPLERTRPVPGTGRGGRGHAESGASMHAAAWLRRSAPGTRRRWPRPVPHRTWPKGTPPGFSTGCTVCCGNV